jgi:hypothetical protein
MALYEYACTNGHKVERLVMRFEDADRPRRCTTCQKPLTRLVSVPHSPPDGVYSYAPNVGDADRFERQREAIKNGQRTLKRSLKPLQEERRQEENYKASKVRASAS